MANYFLNHYATGLKDSYEEASLALEDLLERLDSTNNAIIGKGIASVRRGRFRCVGWVLFEGFFLDETYHLHYADNIDLTVT
jgi:hypothetical protein